MAYYIRKFSRAKWSLLEPCDDNILENYRADTIANDIRTHGNTLSVWRVDTLSDEDIEPIKLVNSLLGDNISSIQLLCIPEELLENFCIDQEDGDTIVEQYRSLHYNISNLSVKLLIDFARDIVLKIMKVEEKGDSEEKLIIQLSGNTQKKLIVEWIKNGKISVEQLKESQYNAISKMLMSS